MRKLNKTEKFWDNVSKNYEKNEQQLNPIHIKVVEKTKKYLNMSDIVLDYGCATGTKAFQLASNVKQIQGIDISSKMIETAKKKAVESKIENVDFLQATIFDESLKKESFDIILAFNILHLLEDNIQVIQRITKLLKPGGLFISTTPCLKERIALLNKFILSFYLMLSKIGLIPSYLKRFKITELKNSIPEGNLQIIKTENLYYKLTSCFIVAKKI